VTTSSGALLSIAVLAVVLQLEGTPAEADAVLSRLSAEVLPSSPTEAHRQIAGALEAIRAGAS
jgi:hypothetical protein